ncbi:MAG: asparagine synthase (glutamine-hydrolyzing) [Cyclobacteriaceae bacterium]
MCGITGIKAFNELGRIQMIHLVKANSALQHRGPDFQRTKVYERVGLGHCRLSVIDPSPKGHQPMTDASERYTIVFNGEIYNYRKLRANLEQAGVTFESESDTEVLLKLFIRKGISCLEEVNGCFAFAIFDQQEDQLWLARDRMGIKPLYYYFDEDKFIFASEMKSLLCYGIEKELDLDALYYYFQLNYVPAPLSMLKGIKKLMPGHFMMVKRKEKEVKSYYQVPRGQVQTPNSKYEDRQEQLVDVIENAVQRRLVADVPVGAFLSGGIDSSIIVAMAARHHDKLPTFSIGYKDEPYFDETKYARSVANKLGTHHTVFELSNRDLFDHLTPMLEALDEPFADSSSLPVYILSKQTKNITKVALSGDGADELFGGYNKHRGFVMANQGGIAVQIAKTFAPLWRRLPKSRNSGWANKVRQMDRLAKGLSLSEQERYWQWAAITPAERVKQLLLATSNNFITDETIKASYLQSLTSEFNLNRTLRADLHLVLPNDMLTKVDLMSMAHGLEVRVPFLDHEVVAAASQIPAEDKIKGNISKRILKDSFRNLMPRDWSGRGKKGFEVPMLPWLRKELKSLIENELLNPAFIKEQEIFNLDLVESWKKQLFSSSPGDAPARIWALVVFQYWWKKYMA